VILLHLLRPKTVLSILAIILACLAFSQEAAAQVQRYQPSMPTTSSYLNLTRFNNGSLPNYYSLVRPQQQQRSFNLQEQALRRQQTASISNLQSDMLRATTATGTGKGSWFMTPGSRSTFLDTTKYYPQPARRGIQR